jgi:hypothetical protein
MMKHIDITSKVLEIHEREELKKAVEEAKKEIAEGIHKDILSEVELLVQKAVPEGLVNVDLNFEEASANEPYYSTETELLAASGQSLGEWFSQPINFAGAGFVLDVRRVVGTENEVDLYLTPNNSTLMGNALSAFKGKVVGLWITNNEKRILEAELYIDESGLAAEGSGTLADAKEDFDIKGKINIEIKIQD